MQEKRTRPTIMRTKKRAPSDSACRLFSQPRYISRDSQCGYARQPKSLNLCLQETRKFFPPLP